MTDMLSQIFALVKDIITVINLFVMIIITALGNLGIISGPSEATPITFEDEGNVKMSFVALADTQALPLGYHQYLLENAFTDIENSDLDFDALVIAGDISELGEENSYEIIWEAIDNSVIDKAILSTGNHDIRFAYKWHTEYINAKAEEYLGIEIENAYYSYDVNGYTFIVMNSDAWQFEKAIISDEQLAFLDSELARATKNGKPAFVICHQPLTDTHGLPTDWEGADLGEDSPQVREILTKYENVFYLNGHLHDGITENSLEVFDEEKGVYSVNLPAFGKENDFGEFLQMGLGAYVEVYSDRVIFTARDFAAGDALEGYTRTFMLK